MKPDVVFFDIGHTLITGAADSPRRLLGARLGLNEKETRLVGKRMMIDPATDPAQLARAIATLLPARDPQRIHQEVARLWTDQIGCVREIPGSTATLARLKDEGIRLGVISNIWHPFYMGFLKECPDISALLDIRVLSYRLGVKKPALELYLRAAAAAATAPERCWMVGDSYELDMEPAAAAGYRTLWILCRPERERATLVELLRGVKAPPDAMVANHDEVYGELRRHFREPSR